jgi:nitrite reductase/ring-hydroxylating ferredoxin subunit
VGAFVTIGPAGQVAEGAAAAFAVDGGEVGVARVGGTLYAFSDICTHRGCNLADGGDLEGTEITCGCHGSVFSVVSGVVIDGPATQPIETYPVRESDGEIQIEV